MEIELAGGGDYEPQQQTVLIPEPSIKIYGAEVPSSMLESWHFWAFFLIIIASGLTLAYWWKVYQPKKGKKK